MFRKIANFSKGLVGRGNRNREHRVREERSVEGARILVLSAVHQITEAVNQVLASDNMIFYMLIL